MPANLKWFVEKKEESLYTKKENRRRKANNSSYKSLDGSMTHWFIEVFALMMGIELIESLGMKSGLIANVHRIIDDNNGEYERHSKFITPYRILESHSSGQCYNKCRMSWRHSSTSKHISKTKMALCRVDDSLYNYCNYKSWEWHSESMFPEKCMNEFNHSIILLRWWWILFDQMEPTLKWYHHYFYR